jgi:hypothetical protein
MMSYTNRDSGVFLYAGWRILNGEIPYRDIWDHKPPIIFFINSAGLALTNNSRWGVWWIELGALLLAAFFSFLIVKKMFGYGPAILSLFLWLFTLVFIIQGGNLTEEYILPMQFIALWLIYDINKPNFSFWRWFLVGLIGAIAFFTKQTSIGIWIAITIGLVYHRAKSKRRNQGIKELISIASGSSVIVAGLLFYFWIHGALPQFINAAFEYNIFYIANTKDLLSRLTPILIGIGFLTKPGLFQLGLFGCLFSVIMLVFKRNSDWKIPFPIFICILDLPIEFIFLSLSGRTYAHYYMTLLPVLTLFAGLAFWLCMSTISRWGFQTIAKVILASGILFVFFWTSLAGYHDHWTGYRNTTYAPLIESIISRTNQDDYVLVWGNEASINYYSQRRSPSRFVYLFPLYQSGYVNEQIIEEYLSSILRNRPKLIIDLKDPGSPFLNLPLNNEIIQSQLDEIQTHYDVIEDTSNWTIYALVE